MIVDASYKLFTATKQLYDLVRAELDNPSDRFSYFDGNIGTQMAVRSFATVIIFDTKNGLKTWSLLSLIPPLTACNVKFFKLCALFLIDILMEGRPKN